MTFSSGCFLFGGKIFDGTIAATLWVRTIGQVPSGFLRCIVTVLGSVASTLLSEPSSDDGPFASAILVWRSSENLTSSEVSGSPLENFRPSLSVQTYVLGSLKSQLSAASGSGLLPPAGIVSR